MASDAESHTEPVPSTKILAGATGCQATVDLFEFCTCLSHFAQVQVMCTDDALHFFSRPILARQFSLYTDDDQWTYTGQNGTLYSDLDEWADVLVILLSANTLVKLSAGICDNLLTRVAKCWQYPVMQNGQRIGGKQIFLYAVLQDKLFGSHQTNDHLNYLTGRNATLIPVGTADDAANFVHDNLN